MRPNPQEPADLIKFTEEVLNGKLHFLWVLFKINLLNNFVKLHTVTEDLQQYHEKSLHHRCFWVMQSFFEKLFKEHL